MAKTSNFDARDAASKNWIINGNFDVWQRRTTQSSITVQTFNTADRWQQVSMGGLSVTSDRVTDVPTFAQSRFASSFAHRLTINTAVPSPAASDFFGMQYRMEGYDFLHLAGKRVTMKFWVKASIAGTYSVSIAAGLDSTRNWVYDYSIPVENVWTKIEIPADFTGYAADPTDFSISSGIGVFISWSIGAGSLRKTSTLDTWAQAAQFNMASTNQVNLAGTVSATFLLAQVQVSLDDDAEFSLYGGTLHGEVAACERYFRNIHTNNGVAISATTCDINVPLSPPMRSAPVPIITGGGVQITDQAFADFTQSSANVSVIGVTNIGGRIRLGNFSGLTSARYYSLETDTGGTLFFDAEL